jgi:hypothetical protein
MVQARGRMHNVFIPEKFQPRSFVALMSPPRRPFSSPSYLSFQYTTADQTVPEFQITQKNDQSCQSKPARRRGKGRKKGREGVVLSSKTQYHVQPQLPGRFVREASAEHAAVFCSRTPPRFSVSSGPRRLSGEGQGGVDAGRREKKGSKRRGRYQSDVIEPQEVRQIQSQRPKRPQCCALPPPGFNSTAWQISVSASAQTCEAVAAA